MVEPADVATAFGHKFSDPGLLDSALTHRSVTAEEPTELSNERLEFLGDAVLGLIVAAELFDGWGLAEGEMSKVRAAVVNEITLAAVAVKIGLGDVLRLGYGEDASGGRGKSPILADAMEALIGAVYLDGGLEAARVAVLRHWEGLIQKRAAAPGELDYKTRLQEELAKRGVTPEYGAVGSGPDHARSFKATVSVAGKVVGKGAGTSKKRAQQVAARRALEALGGHDA